MIFGTNYDDVIKCAFFRQREIL